MWLAGHWPICHSHLVFGQGSIYMPRIRRVAIVLFPDALALDVAGPAEVFAAANQLSARGPAYEVKFVSPSGRPVRTASGMAVQTQPLESIDRDSLDTIVVSGGLNMAKTAANPRLIDWLRSASASARRICGVCTGAFVLAAAGLLDGRRATTHWASAAEFRALFPRVRLDIEPIYTRDGRIWTSAGVTAGIDLALALVQEDCGKRVAVDTARGLVVFVQRPGGQSQYSSLLRMQAHNAARAEELKLDGVESWLAEHLDADLSIERLAERYRMSVRTFARRFVRRAGMSPAKVVEAMRVEAAKRQLEETKHGIKRIAADCGFGDEERMRRAFRRQLAVSPRDYRQRFASR